MKYFKKKHDYLPDRKVVERMIRRFGGPYLLIRYQRALQYGNSVIPEKIRAVTLAEVNPKKRTDIAFYPDLRTFLMRDDRNRSLPVKKFLQSFQGFIPKEELDKLDDMLTNFKLKFYTDPDDWINAYNDDNVHSCMSQSELVKCYSHPENNLALAVLYPPGSDNVCARTIVNTKEMWYVRLFGDPMLVTLLNQQGYRRIDSAPKEFKMYGYCAGSYRPSYAQYPYFDFIHNRTTPLPETYNPATGLFEVIINQEPA